jgi:sarcosine oxidase gamma subunit
MSERLQAVLLPDGTEILAYVQVLEPPPGADTWEPVGYWSAATSTLEGLTDVINGVARSVRDAVRGAAPDEWKVRFGVSIAAKPGKAVALLADGSVSANLVVELIWKPNAEEQESGA